MDYDDDDDDDDDDDNDDDDDADEDANDDADDDDEDELHPHHQCHLRSSSDEAGEAVQEQRDWYWTYTDPAMVPVSPCIERPWSPAFWQPKMEKLGNCDRLSEEWLLYAVTRTPLCDFISWEEEKEGFRCLFLASKRVQKAYQVQMYRYDWLCDLKVFHIRGVFPMLSSQG
eukprot:GHVU01008896.1.p1 GENE.GHVU01008896.1~~GHVU01008896.1.p1  ORF type:complete len:171 (+),score=31.98 GHVU01008896.1:499-1011(+)